MRARIQELLADAVAALIRRGILPEDAEQHTQLERVRNPRHGDFAANIALMMAKNTGRQPRELAEELVRALPASELLAKVEIAGPGFINFFIAPAAYRKVLTEIVQAGKKYGHSDRGRGQKILVEFVSANPTGPLHVGHGRGAAYGDSVARILRASGYRVRREYYVNDAGRQMHILALSVWLRYLELRRERVAFPANGYQGDYVKHIAEKLSCEYGDAFKFSVRTEFSARNFFHKLPRDKESRLDELIVRCQKSLGADSYEKVFAAGLAAMQAEIKRDLQAFGVRFNRWFSERSLVRRDIKRALAALKKGGYIYEEDGAEWFKSTAFGDEKDRAVARADGSHTYFAADIAYHFNKGQRGFDKLLNVFGADHHGYARRISGAFQALGFDAEKLQVRLVQFASLYRDGKKISMSTRGGEFVTLRELCEEVGTDAARFFYAARKNDQHMDFDLALAKKQSADNPVFYIQYAHARICSIFRKLKKKKLAVAAAAPNYELLTAPAEHALMKTLSQFPEVVAHAARDYEPHLLAYYLRELANEFHSYYNAHPFLSSEPKLRAARLGLLQCVKQVIANGLALLGVRAPAKM